MNIITSLGWGFKQVSLHICKKFDLDLGLFYYLVGGLLVICLWAYGFGLLVELFLNKFFAQAAAVCATR